MRERPLESKGPPDWCPDAAAVRQKVLDVQRSGGTVGFVPTMGNLHTGHVSLFLNAAEENDFVVASIFVNPIQFGAGEDFERYPRTPDHDLRQCQAGNVDLIFAPTVDTMYGSGSKTRIQVQDLDRPLCGKTRPTHFTGVATVVAKLFHIVPADAAYFGLKDFQQVRIIEQMVRDLNFPIRIRRCPIVREPDGLAMSSRNAYLSPEERSEATILRRSLDLAETYVQQGERDPRRIRQAMQEFISSTPSGRIDYVELVDPESLVEAVEIDRPVLAAVAVWFRSARLIDNTLLVPPT